MNKASTKPFEGMGDVQILAEMRRLKRDKGSSISASDSRRTRESLPETIKRINAEFGLEKKSEMAETERAAKFRAAELRATQARAISLWKDAGVPDRNGNRTELDTTSENGRKWFGALVTVRWVISQGGTAALVSKWGSGKTQIATESIREATTRGESALFITATKLLRAFKRCYQDEAKTTEEEVAGSFLKPVLLVIDEFHRRKGSDWENQQLFDVLNDRHNAGNRPTILIANQTADEFEASVDGAILDRLNEGGGILECAWGSFRQAANFGKPNQSTQGTQ